MFPSTDSSQTIIDCLLREASQYRVAIRMHADVRKVSRRPQAWKLELSTGEELTADYVCIACGGYSKAAMFDWLKELGHTIEEPLPSLFTFNLPGNPITSLMGVAVAGARVKIKGSSLIEEGPVLVTHWGLSGPAVLRLSAWGARELAARSYRFTATINWIPAIREQELRSQFNGFRTEKAPQKISGKNAFGLPQRLWEFIVKQSGITENMRWADLPSAVQNKLVINLTADEFAVSSRATFKEEFVTAGGIGNRSEKLIPIPCEANLFPGYFSPAGSLDVDGITGGFNFQHAWSGGFIAAKAISKQTMS